MVRAADAFQGIIPNLGQWNHPARFVQRTGSMALFLAENGWIIDLARRDAPRDAKGTIRGAAIAITFEGARPHPEMRGESVLPGHHNYFLGNDASRWRTDVPRYASVLYRDLYPGIDVRMREHQGVPEYDLMLQPDVDLQQVSIRVDGADGLRIDATGALIIDTPAGSITQPKPRTWEVESGHRRPVECAFVLLGPRHFGFATPDRHAAAALTIDPGLRWTTYLGGANDGEWLAGVATQDSGEVIAAGTTLSADFPTTLGAYSRTYRGTSTTFGGDITVVAMDPNQTGAAQLRYATFIGGAETDYARGLSVSDAGVITVFAVTYSPGFPVTPSAYDTSYNGNVDATVLRIDPRIAGTGQLTYATFIGGPGDDFPSDVNVDSRGIITIVGIDDSHSGFPITPGAFMTQYNAARSPFVAQLDLTRTGAAQLIYSTFLAGTYSQQPYAVDVDSAGVITVVGETISQDFPVTTNGFDQFHPGGLFKLEGFMSRLDPSKTGAAQLVYSTYLGGTVADRIFDVVDEGGGVVTMGGTTSSVDFPTTAGAYDRINTGSGDAFVCRLDTKLIGNAQLRYSTFLGSAYRENCSRIASLPNGLIAVAGETLSLDFPTTPDALRRTSGGSTDSFLAFLDPTAVGTAQLRYSTYFGGGSDDRIRDIAVDAVGAVTFVGWSDSNNLPTTPGAYSPTAPGSTGPSTGDGFLGRVGPGITFHADRYALPYGQAATQTLHIDAGVAHAGRSYWIVGSLGSTPGITLGGIDIPLNPDAYTDLTLQFANGGVFTGFRGTLDAAGQATATLNVPAHPTIPRNLKLFHAALITDASGAIRSATNAAPVTIK